MRTANILLVGESKSGKDTLINVLSKGKFIEEYEATQKGKIKYVIINSKFRSDKFKTLMTIVFTPLLGIYALKIDAINFINTSGHNLEDTEKYVDNFCGAILIDNLVVLIMIYVFDASKFYIDKNIKLGIQHTINECKHKNNNSKLFKIKYLALGTRASEVEDKEKLEDEVKRMGIECCIFDLKDIPIEKILKFIFRG
ncbi:hypothetical protein [Brachyspira pilosicoli]|uniref:hypothetical protein n=1 Tax=Brachyspira pilosicoli TaxID=52584 RepID=UPI000C75C15F|nr:hypothetical protein [Brachyspira pilosicoli]PLV58202.1 hypothetical protein BPSP16_08800 [Brachyspira pilosicoli SP16]